ncbi:MAG: phosphoglucosamine mutase [Candidatus Limnocylindria bacterium]
MGRLFGTDGIRGVANVDLTPNLAYDLGRALGHYADGAGRSVVVGRDTRRSGEMLVSALAAGLTSVGTDVLDLGVVTTPCLAYVAETGEHVAGVMVSASHNPPDDNGLKVVSGGRKMDDEAEERLEHLIFQAEALPRPTNAGLGRIQHDPAAVGVYRDHLAAAAGELLSGLRIGVDAANGSASIFAPALFEGLGAHVTTIHCEPDGSNINIGGGATDPTALAHLVRSGDLDLGFAFDGDADRLIAVTEAGDVVDGDGVMGIIALDRLAAGTLAERTLVVSVMSNDGLVRAVEAAGGRVIRAPVGDRHIVEAMERSGAMLGGEQSGHIIFRDLASTGDGLLTAIQLVAALRGAIGQTLGQLAARIPRRPQVVINSAVRHKDQWQVDPLFADAVARATTRLGSRGRIIVRPSGTEPKLRIMVEGEEPEEIATIAQELADLATARLN